MGYRYEFENDSYRLMLDGEIVAVTNEVAIVFSESEKGERAIRTTLHKHGNPDMVLDWLIKTKTKYENAGLHDLSAEFVMLQKDPWDIEELNNSAFLGILGLCLMP